MQGGFDAAAPPGVFPSRRDVAIHLWRACHWRIWCIATSRRDEVFRAAPPPLLARAIPLLTATMPEAARFGGEIWLARRPRLMHLHDMRKSLRAFTLIELLVVIAIIGILASMLFPAVSGAINAARKAQASNDVTQIATAVIAYQTEYGRWPTNASGSPQDVGGDFLEELMSNNPRKIVFLEVNDKKGKKSGLTDGSFEDAWGNPYKYVVDTNYGYSLSGTPAMFGSAPRRNVAVWQQTNENYKGTGSRLPAASW